MAEHKITEELTTEEGDTETVFDGPGDDLPRSKGEAQDTLEEEQ